MEDVPLCACLWKMLKVRLDGDELPMKIYQDIGLKKKMKYLSEVKSMYLR